MMSVNIYGPSDECLGTWYADEGVQVPRKGDLLWLETDRVRFNKHRVVDVQWSFRDKAMGISRLKMATVEVHIVEIKPMWRRFVELFPSPASRSTGDAHD